MGMEAKIPVIEMSFTEIFEEDDKSEKWRGLSRKVREACEDHGCFIVMYNGISEKLRADMLMGMKALFDFPQHTKNMHRNPKPYRSYTANCSLLLLHESFGIDTATQLDAARDFTTLMWSQGNPSFCESLNSMSKKMLELSLTIIKMIFHSFDIGKCYINSIVDDSANMFRLMKYKVHSSKDPVIGLVAHTDRNVITVLCSNDVQGLEIVTREGDWVKVVVPKDAFVVIIGDAFKVWSNRRLVAVKHRVMMSGDKERYSCAMFLLPKEGAMIEVPGELVDNNHPLLYRPFKFIDYLSYFLSNISNDALEVYAGV